ncbi:hypothetical protein AYX14_01417 [Cryptococcus neoformans]|nr:hypothetical protein AYX15_00655 [Cryptococcus neoformans var. grubii]OWZ73161.1 hypothetical protein AYX14_01417 [Cryptococcus neoformans var. grubii]OWZ80635.1 hypothetical protein C365_00456 [Cryptococcus neoformans var. grubii Bt85]OXG23559.1 hypothetical protein C366_00458 [Cryptococcus neoformans var. grubii Tu401-1]
MRTMSSGAIILINGYPGVGKVSMAKQLSKLLPNSRVFDNNFMGDAARLFDKRSELEAYNALRQGMHDTIFRFSTSASHTSQPMDPDRISACLFRRSIKPYILRCLPQPSGILLIHIVLSCSTLRQSQMAR